MIAKHIMLKVNVIACISRGPSYRHSKKTVINTNRPEKQYLMSKISGEKRNDFKCELTR
jgi:hypothetical protein